MLLYHTSPIDFNKINLESSKLFKDFGRGFYATPSEISSMNFLKKNSGFLYTLDLDTELSEIDLNIKTFSSDKEWFDYVYENRTKNITDDYDIVIGKTASNCYQQFKDIRNGKDISLDYKKLLNNDHGIQYCFKTEKSLEYLYLAQKEYLDKELDFY